MEPIVLALVGATTLLLLGQLANFVIQQIEKSQSRV
jgi:hypothetical protein